MRSLCLLAFLLVATGVSTGAAAPSSSSADLKVTVQDQTGAALVIAVVTFVDSAGASHTLTVDARGVATFTALPEGARRAACRGRRLPVVQRTDHAQEGRERHHPPAAARRTSTSRSWCGRTRRIVRATHSSARSTSSRSPSCPTIRTSCEQVLEQMAGPGATMRVNGFRGGRLPPKIQIRSDPLPHELVSPPRTTRPAASASTSSPSPAWTAGAA